MNPDNPWAPYRKVNYLTLNRLCDHQATNPKDMIFGVQPILEKLGFTLPEPDYSKEVEQIYKETALAIVKESKSLEILIHSRSPRERSLVLPSWVPDWSRNIGLEYDDVNHAWIEFESNDEQVTAGTLLFINPFATRHSKYRIPLHQARGQLPVTGFRLGEVNHTGPSLFPGDEVVTIQYRELFRQWYRHMQNIHPRPDGIDGKERPETEWEQWLRLLLNKDPRRVYKGTLKSSDIRHSKRYKVYLGDQHPFRLTSGLHEIGETGIRDGDIVALVHGADYPVVFRPRGRHFRFVGCVYVWGAMLGQLWPENELSIESIMGTLSRPLLLDDEPEPTSVLSFLWRMGKKVITHSQVAGRLKLE
jgi:hypothetical protein